MLDSEEAETEKYTLTYIVILNTGVFATDKSHKY